MPFVVPLRDPGSSFDIALSITESSPPELLQAGRGRSTKVVAYAAARPPRAAPSKGKKG